MTSNRFFYLLFAVIYFSCLTAMLPASLLGSLINKYSQGSLALANCTGSFWNGSATAVFRQEQATQTPLVIGQLQWNISALSILTLQPTISINWPQIRQKSPTIMRTSIGKIDITNLILPLPPAILAQASPYLRPLELDGQIVIQSDSLSATRNTLNGTLSAQLTDFRSGLSNVSPLGNYLLNAQCAGTNCDLSLNTVTGKLILQGKGKFAQNGSFAFNGQAQAAEGQKESLNEILQNIGPESSSGLHTFSIAGKP
ncbi:MAG TPA: type II secretion system protein N [Gallionellaceae bacterium]